MILSELRFALERYGVRLSITADNKLVPQADQPPPPEVIEAMHAHRDALLHQVREGRLLDGRLNIFHLAVQPGHCGCCARWQGPDLYGDGLCPLGRLAHGWYDGNPQAAVLTVAHHECAVRRGEGWQRQ